MGTSQAVKLNQKLETYASAFLQSFCIMAQIIKKYFMSKNHIFLFWRPKKEANFVVTKVLVATDPNT